MPKKTAGYTQMKANQRRDRKGREADIRQGNYDALTINQKIALAMERRGKSTREIGKLQKKLESTQQEPVEKATPVGTTFTATQKVKKSATKKVAVKAAS